MASQRYAHTANLVADKIPAELQPFNDPRKNAELIKTLFNGAVLTTVAGPIGVGVALGAAMTPGSASSKKRFSEDEPWVGSRHEPRSGFKPPMQRSSSFP